MSQLATQTPGYHGHVTAGNPNIKLPLPCHSPGATNIHTPGYHGHVTAGNPNTRLPWPCHSWQPKHQATMDMPQPWGYQHSHTRLSWPCHSPGATNTHTHTHIPGYHGHATVLGQPTLTHQATMATSQPWGYQHTHTPGYHGNVTALGLPIFTYQVTVDMSRPWGNQHSHTRLPWPCHSHWATKHTLVSWDTAIRCLLQNIFGGKWILVQVRAWCQCWLRSKSPDGVTRPQWVKNL